MAEETEAFARKIADRTSGAIALEHARIVAEADNELALIRAAKRALIDRTEIFGDFKTPPLTPTDPSKDPWLMSPALERRFLLTKAKDPEQREEAERSAAINGVNTGGNAEFAQAVAGMEVLRNRMLESNLPASRQVFAALTAALSALGLHAEGGAPEARSPYADLSSAIRL